MLSKMKRKMDNKLTFIGFLSTPTGNSTRDFEKQSLTSSLFATVGNLKPLIKRTGGINRKKGGRGIEVFHI